MYGSFTIFMNTTTHKHTPHRSQCRWQSEKKKMAHNWLVKMLRNERTTLNSICEVILFFFFFFSFFFFFHFITRFCFLVRFFICLLIDLIRFILVWGVEHAHRASPIRILCHCEMANDIQCSPYFVGSHSYPFFRSDPRQMYYYNV